MNTSSYYTVHAEKNPMRNVLNPLPFQIYRNPKVVVSERELSNPLSNFVQLEMLYGGLCGTDIHLLESNPETGYIKCSAPLTIPEEGRVFGHEGIGRVIKTGPNVNHIKVGDIVTFESILVCGYCEECKKGNFNQCWNAKLLGLEIDGVFGTYINIHASLLHRVNNLIHNTKDLKAIACTEPAGVAFVGCQNSKISPGDHVLIFGAGPIGLITAILCKEVFGAASVCMVEPSEFRKEFARKWVDHVYDVDDYIDKIKNPIDIIFETSGYLNNVSNSFSKINPNGKVILLARSGMPLSIERVDHMITNKISIIGSRGHLGGAFIQIFKLYKQNMLPLADIVTSIVDWKDELNELLKTPEIIINNNCKVLIKFNDYANKF